MGRKEPILIQSVEQLDKILEEKESYQDFFISFGFARSSKEIMKVDGIYYILHGIDDTEDQMDKNELLNTNIHEAITNNCFYYQP